MSCILITPVYFYFFTGDAVKSESFLSCQNSEKDKEDEMGAAYNDKLPSAGVTLYDYILTASMKDSSRRSKGNFGGWVLCPPDTKHHAYGPSKPMESFVVIPKEDEGMENDVISDNMDASADVELTNMGPTSGMHPESDNVDEFELVDFDSCRPQSHSFSIEQCKSYEGPVVAADVAKLQDNLQTEMSTANNVPKRHGCDPFSDLEIVSAEDLNSSVS